MNLPPVAVFYANAISAALTGPAGERAGARRVIRWAGDELCGGVRERRTSRQVQHSRALTFNLGSLVRNLLDERLGGYKGA